MKTLKFNVGDRVAFARHVVKRLGHDKHVADARGHVVAIDGPVVVVLPSTTTANTTTPAGRPVVICPATQRDDVSCASCQLCQRQRTAIVGFPAHGARHRVINLRLASA